MLDDKTNGPIVDEYLQTSINGIFSCGISLYVNDLADNVTEEGYIAADGALKYIRDEIKTNHLINLLQGNNVNILVPQRITGENNVVIRVRSKIPLDNAFIRIPEIGLEKKEKFIRPGELIYINLKRFIFKFKQKVNELTVNIDKV